MTNERLLTSTRDFQLVAGHPALDFLNTLDWRFRKTGADDYLKTYGDLATFTALSKLISRPLAEQLIRSAGLRAGRQLLERAVELREALADVLYAPIDGRAPPAAGLRTLERYFHEAALHRKLAWNGSGAVWDQPGPPTDLRMPLWLFSVEAEALLTSDAAQLVRECGNPECRFLFLDTSKNHTRRWCDMKLCGNRMKARRFKAQHVNL